MTIFAGFFMLFFIFFILFDVFKLIGLYKIFKKAGIPGWKAFIPFYNRYILIEISGLNKFYFLLVFARVLNFVPGLNLVIEVLSIGLKFFIYYNLGLKFHREGILSGCLGVFVEPFTLFILGVSKKYVYDKDVVVSQHGPIKENQH